jgi:hypothetical protein
MVRGGDGLTPEAITHMARAWIFWDWFRMAGTLGPRFESQFTKKDEDNTRAWLRPVR